jgi:hypothetical protein
VSKIIVVVHRRREDILIVGGLVIDQRLQRKPCPVLQSKRIEALPTGAVLKNIISGMKVANDLSES